LQRRKRFGQTRAVMVNQTVINRKFYPQGTLIFSEGDFGDSLYVIQKGTVEIFCDGDKAKNVLGRIGRGEIFGEMALVDGQPRMASAMTVIDTEVMVVPGTVFRDHLKSCTPFMRGVINILVRNLRVTAEQKNPRKITEGSEDLKALIVAEKD